MSWLIPAAVAISALQRRQQEKQRRQAAITDISAQRASSLGYPTYGVQAQGVLSQEDSLVGPDMLGTLLQAQERDDDDEDD